MADNAIDIKRLDEIVRKTVNIIDESKSEIYDIAEDARNECERLEKELKDLKKRITQITKKIEITQQKLKVAKRKLALMSKKFSRSDIQLQQVYEEADNLRIKLAVTKEQEQNLICRRNEVEIRLKQVSKTVKKAENLLVHVGAAMDYLSGNLSDLSSQLMDIREKQNFGIKIIEAQEEERQRVAREIHDGPAQTMSNVVIKADFCEKLIDIDVNKVKSELEDLKKVVRCCLHDVRRIIYDLRPMSLDDLGLVPTIKKYVYDYEVENGINIEFKADEYIDVNSVISLTTFRIIQEALNNIKKHAKAKNIIIGLSVVSNSLFIRVRDDGVGFDMKEVKERSGDYNGGFGLCSINERVELLNGSLKIHSQFGKGTRINVRIPLEAKED